MSIKNKNFLLALSVLIGTIIGAGIFGIPYVIARSGLIPGFFYFIVLGSLVTLIHLFLGEIVLRTKEQSRLPGLTQKYLGKTSKVLITISVIIGVVGALLAYLILAGDFLKIIFQVITNNISIDILSSFHFTIIFWLILSYFVFRGIKLIAPVELITNIFFLLVIFLIVWFCLPKFNFLNFTSFNLPNIFLPYGVILFSLIGWSAIPEIRDILKSSNEKRDFKKIIISATIITIFLYLLFTLLILGVSGKNITPDTLSGLLSLLGKKIIFFGALAGLITLADSFLVLALHLRNTFMYDLKFSKNFSVVISCGLPLVLFLLGFRSFINIIGFVGTVIGVIEGIIIVLIFKKAKTLGDREPEYSLKIPSILLYSLIAILILGAISQIF